MIACFIVFLVEMGENNWVFQPLTCPRTCGGRPCDEFGRLCEPNMMLGPTVAVMDRMGAKNDEAIFVRGEWWRIIACNWLHAGIFHLLFNL